MKVCPSVAHPPNHNIRVCHPTVGRETEAHPSRRTDVHCKRDCTLRNAEVPMKHVRIFIPVVEGGTEGVSSGEVTQNKGQQSQQTEQTPHRGASTIAQKVFESCVHKIQMVWSCNPMWYRPNWPCDFRCQRYTITQGGAGGRGAFQIVIAEYLVTHPGPSLSLKMDHLRRCKQYPLAIIVGICSIDPLSNAYCFSVLSFIPFLLFFLFFPLFCWIFSCSFLCCKCSCSRYM